MSTQTIEAQTKTETLTGAEILVRALVDQGVDTIFGYPGGAVLPIYDALFHEPRLHHVLVRHEQGATHAARATPARPASRAWSWSRRAPAPPTPSPASSTPLMDSIPLVVITGQVATHLIGSDAFQEADTVGITRSCTKHNYLVKRVEDLARVVHEAFHIATSGRPGPVVIDIPKDVQFLPGPYIGPEQAKPLHTYNPRTEGDPAKIAEAMALLASAKKPILYTGGGIINAGPEASKALRELAHLTGAPVTSTLMGLGAFPASDPQWLGMLGMHGSFESNHAMHDADVMLCLGARFDDRITGRLDAFAPNSKKVHVDIDPSSINKNVLVDIGIVGDAASVIKAMVKAWKGGGYKKADLTGLVGRHRRLARTQGLRLPPGRQGHQAAVRHRAPVRPDQGPRDLHLHRGRPAPDVGRPVLPLRGAQPLDDLRGPGHHGLRPARRGGRPDGAQGTRW